MSMSQPLIGRRYRLVRPLGRGGMGTVWLAQDEVLHRDVAIKEIIVPAALTEAEGDQARRRSMREARAAARLTHPNVVRMYDVVEDAGRQWIVMEHVPSRSLHDMILQDGPLPPERVARIGLGVLAALRAAHRAGVLHRDVKPSNVLLTADGRVVLGDFGLAIIEGVDTTVTRSGMILGSPAYISPERAREGISSPASDLWSLGATLYAAVEGRSPYERTSAIATLTALATEEPDPAPRAGRLRPVLKGLLRKNPEARIDAEEAHRLLLRAANPAPDPSWRLIPRSGSRRRAVAKPRPALAATALPRPATAVLPPAPESPESPESPATEAPAARERRRMRPGSRRLAAALLGLAALLLAAVAASPRGEAGGPAPPKPSAPASVPPTGSPQPSIAQSTLATGRPTLPAGWRLYHDPTGFTVAVPGDWRMSRDGTIVYFRDSATGRVLGIDQSPNPKWDPVADWTAQEAARLRGGDWRDYRRIKIVAVPYFLAAADWEFTYAGTGGRIHVINRGFVASPRQAHAIYWSTPEPAWQANLPTFELIVETFEPIPR
jgi:eukaryotic-like serine/threonine-protein kinase